MATTMTSRRYHGTELTLRCRRSGTYDRLEPGEFLCPQHRRRGAPARDSVETAASTSFREAIGGVLDTQHWRRIVAWGPRRDFALDLWRCACDLPIAMNAGRTDVEEWLLIEWPSAESEPTSIGFHLPSDTTSRVGKKPSIVGSSSETTKSSSRNWAGTLRRSRLARIHHHAPYASPLRLPGRGTKPSPPLHAPVDWSYAPGISARVQARGSPHARRTS